MKREFLRFISLTFMTLVICQSVLSQTTAFTYQGSLQNGGIPANGNYDFEFGLFSVVSGGTQMGATFPIPNVAVANGVFTVSLDFGSQFPGANRFLEVRVRQTGGGAFTTLTPRQLVNSSPYSIQSLNATNATTATNATNATTAVNVSGVVAIANGGTGSTTKNFVDLTTNQSVGGTKRFTNAPIADGSQLTNINGANITNNTINASALASDTFPNNRNLSLLGQRRWDLLGQRVAVGNGPRGVAFDGANIWVTNAGSNNVTKLRASDGALQGTFAVGTSPFGVAFDGANIWVANNSSTVTKLRASDGALQGTFAAGANPREVAFDGANIWVSNASSNNVIKLPVFP